MSVVLSHSNRQRFNDSSCCDECRYDYRKGHMGKGSRKAHSRSLTKIRRTIKRRERIFVRREILAELEG